VATKTVLVDDINGKEDEVRTVRLTYDGVQYSIDLGKASRVSLDAALRPFLQHARSRGDDRPARIRAWATDNGFEVPSRGRIPKDVEAAYEEAIHG
jgi:hypothetical protein